MSDRKPTNQVQMKKQRRPRGSRGRGKTGSHRYAEDSDIVVSGSGNIIHSKGRGDYSLAPLLKLLAPFTSLLESIFGGASSDEGKGRGAYLFKKNTLLLSGDLPSIDAGVKARGGVRVTHKEFVGYVTSAPTTTGGMTDFQNTVYHLNPGLAGLFPWLSTLATSFQEYEILGMIFAYQSTSGNATGANTALGDVIISSNYNSAAAPFTTAPAMLNTEFATRTKPSESAYHGIEADPHQTPLPELFVRSSGVGSEDLKTYDHATVQVATVGCPTASQQLGELWCCFDIAFFKPIVPSVGLGNQIPTDKFLLTGVDNTHPMGTTQSQVVSEGFIGGVFSGNGTIYSFPSTIVEGTFLVVWNWQGGAATAVAPLISFNASYTQLQVWSTGSGFDSDTLAKAPRSGSTNSLILAILIQFVASPTLPVTVTLGTAGTLPTTPYADMIVTQVNPNFSSLLRDTEDQRIQQLVEAQVQKILGRLSSRQSDLQF